MRERPILFSAPMIREILADRKTQTRRVVKPQPVHAQVHEWAGRTLWDAESRTWCWRDVVLGDDLWDARNGTARAALAERSPYGQPGDRLWVRETFSPFAIYSAPVRIDAASYVVLADGTQVYRDGAIVPGLAEYAPGAADHIRWRPSIHMPRWASRLTLEVTSVRVERLHDLTEDDARAEGCDWSRPEPYGAKWDDDREDPREVGYPPAGASFARDNFRRLWSIINGPGSWEANPWAWVVNFKRIEVRHG